MRRVQLPVPTPAASPDVDLGPALDTARRLLAGWGPAHLLHQVSVARAAAVIVELVREPGDWLRLLLGSLDRFGTWGSGTWGAGRSLAAVLTAAWADPATGDRVLQEFAASLGAGETELARLGFGPKLWFTLNGVPVTWRPLRRGLPRTAADPGRAPVGEQPDEAPLRGPRGELSARDALLAGGLTHAELGYLRLADLGRLGTGAVFVPDLAADPLVVRAVPRGERPRLAFLTPRCRAAVLDAVARGHDPDGDRRHPEAPLLPALAGG